MPYFPNKHIHLEINNGNTPSTTPLNAQVVLIRLDAEPAILAPVLTPAVATDPVLLSLLGLAPSSHLNDVSAQTLVGVVHEDASLVVQELLRHTHVARDGSTREDLRLHVLFAAHVTEVTDLVALVLLDGLARLIGLAVLAAVHVVALLVHSLVHGTCLVGNTLLVRVAVHAAVPAAVAAARVAAVDHLLHRQLHGGPGALSHQVDTVGDGRGGALRPAGAAVHGDVLVLVPGGVVVSVDVADVVALGDLRRVQVRVRQRSGDHRLHDVPVVGDGARTREVARTVVRRAHAVVANHLLRHLRHGPRALALDAQVVDATRDAEPALLAPVGSPAVTRDPVLLAVLLAPADHRDRVLQRRRAALVLVDAALVGKQVVGDGDGAGDGTTSVQLLHHVLLAGHVAVLLHVVLGEVLDSVAGSVMSAVTADVEVRALVVVGSVTHAALVRDTHLLHHLVGRQHVSSMAAGGSVGAVHNHLGRQLLSGPGSLGHQTQTIGNGGGGGESPARSAVLGKVLVLGDGHVGHAVDVTTRDQRKLSLIRIVSLGKLLALQVLGGLSRSHEGLHLGISLVAAGSRHKSSNYALSTCWKCILRRMIVYFIVL